MISEQWTEKRTNHSTLEESLNHISPMFRWLFIKFLQSISDTLVIQRWNNANMDATQFLLIIWEVIPIN